MSPAGPGSGRRRRRQERRCPRVTTQGRGGPWGRLWPPRAALPFYPHPSPKRHCRVAEGWVGKKKKKAPALTFRSTPTPPPPPLAPWPPQAHAPSQSPWAPHLARVAHPFNRGCRLWVSSCGLERFVCSRRPNPHSRPRPPPTHPLHAPDPSLPGAQPPPPPPPPPTPPHPTHSHPTHHVWPGVVLLGPAGGRCAPTKKTTHNLSPKGHTRTPCSPLPTHHPPTHLPTHPPTHPYPTRDTTLDRRVPRRQQQQQQQAGSHRQPGLSTHA